ncbi:hypothetical protein FQR65_LT19377 [Abscondita terminalis]|nr:hypothetical protein FQR65_LT19377 [Abscondita terminalis]
MYYVYCRRKMLQEQLGEEYHVELAMRYQNPSIEQALKKMEGMFLESIRVIPLFPQYASATTDLLIDTVMELMRNWQYFPEDHAKAWICLSNDHFPSFISRTSCTSSWKRGERSGIQTGLPVVAYEYSTELGEYMIFVMNTNVKHSLARRSVQQAFWKNVNLRCFLIRCETILRDEDVYIKCRYVVEENLRVVAACQAMEKGDLVSLGQHIYASHKGLSKAYQVSCEELDFLVDATYDILMYRLHERWGVRKVYLSNLAEKDCSDQFIKEISASYQQQFGVSLTPYIVETADAQHV